MYDVVEVGVETLCPCFQIELWEESTKLKAGYSHRKSKTSFKMKVKSMKMVCNCMAAMTDGIIFAFPHSYLIMVKKILSIDHLSFFYPLLGFSL